MSTQRETHSAIPMCRASRLTKLAGLALSSIAVLAGCSEQPAEQSTSIASTEITGTLNVFAAASLTETFTELEREFEAQHPKLDVVLVFAGSPMLAQQIEQGAPADVFASANEEIMHDLIDDDLADYSLIFATNTLEIAVSPGNPSAISGVADFGRIDLAIALCASEVPCGDASRKVLSEAHIIVNPDTLEPNVKAVLAKIKLGEVDAGLVYRTDVVAAEGMVEGIPFEAAANVINRYPIAVLREAKNMLAAEAFVKFVSSPQARHIFTEAGFGGPK